MDQPFPNVPYLAPAVWGFGLALLALGAFSVQLALSWRGGIRASALVGVVVLSALCAAGGLAYAIWRTELLWGLWRLADLARAAGWSFFVLLLLRAGRMGAATDQPGRDLSATLPFLVVAGLVPALVAILVTQTFRADAAAGDRASYAVSLGLAVFGLVCVEQLLRNTQTELRWEVKPLCIGLGGVFVFDLFMYADSVLFGQLDPAIWSAHGAVQACVIPFVALSTARSKEWAVNLRVSRQVVFHSTALLGSGVYLLGVAAIGYYVRYFGGSWGVTVQIAFLFAALVLLGTLITSGTLRSKLRVFVNKHFFSYRYDYREEWLRFTSLIAHQEQEANIHKRVVQALADLVESPAGAVWVKREGVLRQVARWNAPEIPEVEPADASLPAFVERTGWVVDLHEREREPARYADLQIPGWLSSWHAAWLVIPLLAGENLVGFVVLADARVKVEVNWEVLDLLKAASRQATSFLAQIEANVALLEAEKFAAFNRMSAFVVHDLKNLVAQLSLMLKNAERHRDNAEFQRDMADTIRHVVERMNRLLTQLRLEASPVENAKRVDLSAIVHRVRQSKSAHRAGLTVDAAQPVFALGHQDRLEHVVGHLVQNAIDATTVDGKILVRVTQEGATALLEIIDDGVGMSSEFIQTRLFKPFQTTKREGMGIGAYESQQYVASLGGAITVQSQPGQGTRVRLALPQPPQQLREVA